MRPHSRSVFRRISCYKAAEGLIWRGRKGRELERDQSYEEDRARRRGDGCAGERLHHHRSVHRRPEDFQHGGRCRPRRAGRRQPWSARRRQ
ncbi:hypothetical protein MPL3365_250030 [Mesorhizobium plurifarium]|uniref:Uncharacterized protein n=1 Tax=Mesorhizobium plurifarium TaxID=69974 RepID=A0A090GBU4_MESPL|nr:hypothetical protein MPL3365_250030 [Mesorhizobium plurifarium]